MTVFRFVVIPLFAILLAVLAAGQFGLFRGRAPDDLGYRFGGQAGRLKPANEAYWNVASSQATTPYHQVEPLAKGRAAELWPQLVAAAKAQPRSRVTLEEPNYLRMECQTLWMKFVDDLELYRDDQANVVHVRSASRLGRKDFGVNRARVEALRAQVPGA
jgi:uncharacterized protein (DUF1499 family)